MNFPLLVVIFFFKHETLGWISPFLWLLIPVPCVAATAVLLTEGLQHPPGVQLQKRGCQVGAWG